MQLNNLYFLFLQNYSTLDAFEKQAICDFLIQRTSLLSEASKMAKIGDHSMKLIPSSKPKLQKPYWISEILKEADKKSDDEGFERSQARNPKKNIL